MTVRPEPFGRDTPDLITHWALLGPAGARVCCIVPSPAGSRLFRRRGERGVRAALASWLADARIDGELRLMSTLPPAGAELAPRPRWPLIRSTGRSAGSLDCTIQIPYDLALLAGHFPWAPIVPGAALIGWAAEIAANEALWSHGVVRAEALKFRKIVQPGHEYRLLIDVTAGGARLDLRFESARGLHASGVLLAP